ncbi:site-specific recombinase [Vibrio parahaemolyticus]|nr:site-specific recombinase [Vibrio parahaemolyticus]
MDKYNMILSNISNKKVINHEKAAVNASSFDTYNDILKNSNDLLGIYEHELDCPFWLKSDFDDEIWIIDLKSKEKKHIEWNKIILSDGKRLTHIKNRRLLNFFKYLILSPNCPITNGGAIKKVRSIEASIGNSIRLINLLLSNDELLNLNKDTFRSLNDDFIFSILLKYCIGGYHYVLNYNKKLNDYINTLPYITKDGMPFEEFLKSFPYLSNNIDTLKKPKKWKNRVLESAYKLYINGFYKKRNSNYILHKPNYALITNAIFKDSIIPIDSFRYINELDIYQIKDDSRALEFKAINNYNNSSTISKSTIEGLIYIINHIPISAQLAKIDNLNFDPNKITVQRLNSLHNFKEVGRTFSLPPHFVLKSMEKAFTLNFKDKFNKSDLWYPEIIDEGEPVLMIDLLYDTIIKYKEETKGLDSNSKIYRNIIEESRFTSNKLKSLGFNKLLPTRGLRHRDSNSIIYYFKVLTGSIYVLTGSLNARRVSELTSLHAVGNLNPNNHNPWLKDDDGSFVDFYLCFSAAKTGIGSGLSPRNYEERPTPLIVSKLIYKIEKYNSYFINKNLSSINDIALFNGVAFNTFELHSLDTKQYNEAMCYFCDYIETPTALIDGVEYRYYITEHELRRFFALLFFWSSGDKKMESLRYQLVHADVKHLYNYISESIPGDIFNCTKATYLSQRFKALKDTDFEKLNRALLNEFGVNSINLTSTDHFMTNYFPNGILDEDFELNINSDILIKQSELEAQIFHLLDNDIISLDPEFYINEENEHSFKFIIKVKDIYDEY